MTRIEEIETAVTQLEVQDLARFRDWFLRYDADAWDRQIEEDVAAGRLDAAASEAIQDFRAGRCRRL